MQLFFAYLGDFLYRHGRAIRIVQCIIILVYAVLIIVPPFLPLPSDTATLVNNFVVVAQFLFWGIWWPFVLLSIIFFGRLWCGVLCPEGAISEFANRYGLQKVIPHWMRWGGWPFVTFLLTTVYGQMTSVYQYPKPVILVLGGSTFAAIIIGLIYGKSSRVWCKYLCPVTGVFALLARLAPYRFKPDKTKWKQFTIKEIKPVPVHCPTVLPLRTMTSASECLMCGKCSSHREAIKLTLRSPNEEIIEYGESNTTIWHSLLLIYGLCGVALAAFQWTNSFWLNHLRDVIESWFLVHNIMWVFNSNAPWWIFTNYPNQNDTFSWIFGIELVSYMLVVGFIFGSIIYLLINLCAFIIDKKLRRNIFKHLSLALVPLAGASVFIGLFALTITLLQKYANLGFIWINELKAIILILATIWGSYLTLKIIQRYTNSFFITVVSFSLMLVSMLVVDYSWILVLHIWSIKADAIPWYTLWVNF